MSIDIASKPARRAREPHQLRGAVCLSVIAHNSATFQNGKIGKMIRKTSDSSVAHFLSQKLYEYECAFCLLHPSIGQNNIFLLAPQVYFLTLLNKTLLPDHSHGFCCPSDSSSTMSVPNLRTMVKLASK